MYVMSNNSIFRKNSLFRLSIYLLFLFLIVTIVFDYFTSFYNKSIKEEHNSYSQNEDKNSIKKHLPITKIVDKETKNILVLADSHNNEKAFVQVSKLIKNYNISLVVHLGDHSDYGSESEITNAKNLLDSLQTEYIAIPGDRDLAATGGDDLFFTFFKRINSFKVKEYKFLLLNNSPNFTPLTTTYLNSFINEISSTDFILSSQPIYVEKGNIFESKYMGAMNKDYLIQRDLILEKLRNSKVKYVISGDHHRSSNFYDLKRRDLQYFIVGATAEDLNSNGLVIKQKSFQTQRALLISITNDNDILFNEIEVFEE